MREAALPAAAIALRTQAVNLIGQGEVEAGLEMFVDSVSLPGAWKKSTSRFRTMAIDNASTLPKQLRDPLPAYSQHTAGDIACRTLLIDGQRSRRCSATTSTRCRSGSGMRNGRRLPAHRTG